MRKIILTIDDEVFDMLQGEKGKETWVDFFTKLAIEEIKRREKKNGKI